MEIVYLILIFLAPGLLMNAITDIKVGRSRARRSGTIYEQLLVIVIYSVIVSLTSILAISLITYKFGVFSKETNLKGFISSLDYMPKLLSYLAIMITVCFIIEIIIRRIISPAIFKLRNKKLDELYGVKQAQIDDSTVWEDLMLDKERDRNANIIIIYQGNEKIAAGFLESWNRSSREAKEVELTRTREINKIIQMDSEKLPEDRWLKSIEKEYVDIDNNIRIEFYNNKRVKEHWDDFEL